MALVVVASNVLVQFPVQGSVGGLALADILTWGAFTYPFAFLVTDLANRRYGPAVARARSSSSASCWRSSARSSCRRCSSARPDRIRDRRRPAGAHRRGLRRGVPRRRSCSTSPSSTGCAGRSWWRAPVFGSLAGSVLDTAIFFTIAFAAAVRLRRPERRLRAGARAAARRPAASRRARWMSWAIGDLGGEAADRRLRADPLPADRRALEPARPVGRLMPGAFSNFG